MGASSNLGGIRSSVNGTRGSIDMIDIVRKSSGIIIGAVIFEIDLAADLRALRDAVRFDLNVNLRTVDDGSTSVLSSSLFTVCSNVVESRSSTSNSEPDKGCSGVVSPGGDGKDCNLLVGIALFPLEPGVAGEPKDKESPQSDPSSRDGTDSVDIVLDER